jgi:cytochrome P450 family 6
VNQHVQERLRDEINEVMTKHNGQLTFEAINEMNCLDMVFLECIRTFPHDDVIQIRQSTRDFNIPNSNLVIPAKTLVLIPVYGLHNDERFWENPEKFNPERFLPENVKKRRSFVFYPFGDGPRICPGIRWDTFQDFYWIFFQFTSL